MNKSMNLHRQHGNKSGKNIDRPENDGSTNISHNKHKEEEKIRCGICLYSSEDEDECYIDNTCSHHMTGDKCKTKSLRKNQDGKLILGNSAPTEVLGKF